MRLCCVIVFLSFFIVNSSYGAATPQIDLNLQEDEFAISFLPLKEGEVAILHLPSGDQYLINTGPVPMMDKLYFYLNHFQYTNIKGILITEESEYYPESIKRIQEDFPVEQVYIGSKLVKAQKGKLPPNVFSWDKNKVLTISPNLSLHLLQEGSEKGEGLNFTITFFKQRFLWLSSHSESTESLLMKRILKDICIMKIPVESKTETISDKLLKHIDPQTAILYRSKERMLNGELLESINETWIDLYLTGQHGLISIKFNQTYYEVITY